MKSVTNLPGTTYANPHAPTSVGSSTLTYDNNGNLLTYGPNTYGWDYRNRLASSTVGGVVTTYGYDHADARVYQTSNGATTTYANKWYSIVSTTSGSTTLATSTSYIWAGDTMVAYIEQAMINGTATGTAQTYFVHPDHLGSTNVVTNASGTVASVKDYYPYGAVRISSSPTSPKRGYIGQFEDTTGLSYLNARYYNPDQGQFLSEDPMFWVDPKQQNLQDPQSFNSYSYSENNPIIKKDPSGKCPMCMLAIGGAGAGILGQFGYDIYNNVQAGGWGNALSNFSSGDVYLTRAIQGAAVGLTGGAVGGLSIAAQAGIVGGASGVSGVLGNAYLGEPITAQSVLADTIIGGLTFGAGKFVNAVPGRLPNPGTIAFNFGKHAQQSAMQLGVGSISNYTSQIIGNFNFGNSGSAASSQSAAKAMGIGNTGGGTFVGTYNFGSGAGTFNFGTGSWVGSVQSTPATIKK